jgi:PAS domain S-box-containing protein
LMRLNRNGQVENLELEIPTARGNVVPVSFSCTLMRDNQRKITGVLAVAHDMRHTRSLIDGLRAARKRFEELLEFAPEAMVLTGSDGRIVFVNSQAEKLFGYLREELANQLVEMLFPERLRGEFRTGEVLEIEEAGGSFNRIAVGSHAEFMGLDNEGREFPIEIIQRQIQADEGQLTMSIIRDISARKRIEQERADMLAREREARRLAEEASRVKDDFLTTVSHELRAPLTAVLGWTKLLRGGQVDRATAEHALLTIERNVKSQAHLIGDLLDASRIATGKLRLEKRPLELIALIESSVDALRPSVEANQLRLQMVLEPWVGPFSGDPERIKQVIWNLLSNAVKFTPPGGLIEVRLEKLDQKALLIVSDTGQGIDPEFLPNIFDRFRQEDSSTNRTAGGLGLGLAIVKYIVEAHGGAIYAYSAGIGRGADFMITMPLAASTGGADLWSVVAEPSADKRPGGLHGVRVLVVDDERDTREVLGVMLNRYGAEVRAAASAAQGLATLRSWLPDALVSDIGMPIEDGNQLIAQVRELPAGEGGDTPAIALTAFAGTQDREDALSSGFQVHVAKPVEPAELARLIARLVGRNEADIK